MPRVQYAQDGLSHLYSSTLQKWVKTSWTGTMQFFLKGQTVQSIYGGLPQNYWQANVMTGVNNVF